MVSILKKEIRDRTLILTDDFSSIMNNILSYCDLCMNTLDCLLNRYLYETNYVLSSYSVLSSS